MSDSSELQGPSSQPLPGLRARLPPSNPLDSSTAQRSLLQRHRPILGLVLLVAWITANVVYQTRPNNLVAATIALLLISVDFGILILLAYDAIAQLFNVSPSVAASILAISFGVVVFAEPTFTFVATQSYSSAERTLLPLGTPGLTNIIASMISLGFLIGIPAGQFQLKRKTQRQWQQVDDIIARWAPRLGIITVVLSTFSDHYGSGPLAHTPLPVLTIGSLFAAVLLPPVLRPVVKCIIRDGAEGLILAPRHWLSTATAEITREKQAVKTVNWDDAYARYRSTINQFGGPDTSAGKSALKGNGGAIWSAAQRKAYHRPGRLERWQIAKLDALPGWSWNELRGLRRRATSSPRASRSTGTGGQYCNPLGSPDGPRVSSATTAIRRRRGQHSRTETPVTVPSNHPAFQVAYTAMHGPPPGDSNNAPSTAPEPRRRRTPPAGSPRP
jgi:hypothetical protein